MKLTAALGLGLALSLAGNAFLGWQWAGAEAECRADMERAARIAITNERERASKADKEAAEIHAKAAADTSKATRKAAGDTHARDQAIRNVPVTGGCRMPDGLPRLQPAIDEANAAAGD